MDDNKPKKDKRGDTHFVPFLSLWTIAPVLGWFTFYILMTLLDLGLSIESNIVVAISAGAIFGGVIGTVTEALRAFAIRHYQGVRIKGWWRWSSIAWLISGMLFFVFNTTIVSGMRESVLLLLIQASIIFGIPAIVQVWLLRRYVNSAWLWLLSVFAGSSLFAVLTNYGDSTGATFGFGAYSLVTGLTLIWLLGMTRQLPAQQQENQSTDHAVKRLLDKPEISHDFTVENGLQEQSKTQ